MVRLTPDLIQQSMQYLNPCRDRELSLRGYRIPIIENLGATLDQFDSIDLSDNDIRKLDGFPFLKRLSTLILNHNPIVRIAENLQEFIPNLQNLILTGNMIQDLNDLNPLSTLAKLHTLSLLHNPVSRKQHYRAYTIFKIPSLKVLDFKKIKLKEREEAVSFFRSKEGKELRKVIGRKSKFIPGEGLPELRIPSAQRTEEMRRIREAIAKASSLEEVERLNHLLQAGQVPGEMNGQSSRNEHNGMEVEQEEEEEEEEEYDEK